MRFENFLEQEREIHASVNAMRAFINYYSRKNLGIDGRSLFAKENFSRRNSL